MTLQTGNCQKLLRQHDPVGSEDNIYSLGGKPIQDGDFKRHLTALTMMIRICVKSFLFKNERTAPFYIVYDHF